MRLFIRAVTKPQIIGRSFEESSGISLRQDLRELLLAIEYRGE